MLLAFVVEQWRDDLNEARDATAALSLVRAELRQNLEELEKVAPSRRGSLQAYENAITQLVKENKFPQNLPLFQLPTVTNLAYQLATDSGAVTAVDAEDLLVIARAYESVEDIRRNEIFLDERNAQVRFNDGEQYLSGFIYYLNRAIAAEPDTMQDIEKAIDLLDGLLE